MIIFKIRSEYSWVTSLLCMVIGIGRSCKCLFKSSCRELAETVGGHKPIHNR